MIIFVYMEKPSVCICDLTVLVTPKKIINRIKRGTAREKKEAIEKNVYSIKLKDYPITLNSFTKEFPTEKTKQRVLKSIWINTKQKKQFDSVFLQVENINIKKTSNLGYEFDYSKH
jgi:hypothetical protein